jgi:hypothetical protein
MTGVADATDARCGNLGDLYPMLEAIAEEEDENGCTTHFV